MCGGRGGRGGWGGGGKVPRTRPPLKRYVAKWLSNNCHTAFCDKIIWCRHYWHDISPCQNPIIIYFLSRYLGFLPLHMQWWKTTFLLVKSQSHAIAYTEPQSPLILTLAHKIHDVINKEQFIQEYVMWPTKTIKSLHSHL